MPTEHSDFILDSYTLAFEEENMRQTFMAGEQLFSSLDIACNIQNSLENRGLCAQGLEVLSFHVPFKMYTQHPVPTTAGLEDYSFNRPEAAILQGAMEGVIGDIWNAIVNFFKKIFESIKRLFGIGGPSDAEVKDVLEKFVQQMTEVFTEFRDKSLEAVKGCPLKFKLHDSTYTGQVVERTYAGAEILIELVDKGDAYDLADLKSKADKLKWIGVGVDEHDGRVVAVSRRIVHPATASLPERTISEMTHDPRKDGFELMEKFHRLAKIIVEAERAVPAVQKKMNTEIADLRKSSESSGEGKLSPDMQKKLHHMRDYVNSANVMVLGIIKNKLFMERAMRLYMMAVAKITEYIEKNSTEETKK